MPESSNSSLSRFLDAIDREDNRLDKLKSEHMAACKGPRGRIRDVKKAVREAEFNMTAFNAVLAKHRADRRQEQRVARLEPDDADTYATMLQNLGQLADTPLGQAALNRAKPHQAGDEALSSL